jgi:hypothetical protein
MLVATLKQGRAAHAELVSQVARSEEGGSIRAPADLPMHEAGGPPGRPRFRVRVVVRAGPHRAHVSAVGGVRRCRTRALCARMREKLV